jgi:hypothetical protein
MTPEERAEKVYEDWLDTFALRPVDEWPQVSSLDKERLLRLIAAAICEERESQPAPADAAYEEIRPIWGQAQNKVFVGSGGAGPVLP